MSGNATWLEYTFFFRKHVACFVRKTASSLCRRMDGWIQSSYQYVCTVVLFCADYDNMDYIGDTIEPICTSTVYLYHTIDVVVCNDTLSRCI